MDFLRDVNVFGLICLAVVVAVLVSFTKKLVFFAWPESKPTENLRGQVRVVVYSSWYARLYAEIVVYALPYVVAVLLAVSKSEFLFSGVAKYGYFSRVCYTFFVATFSAQIMRAVQKALPHRFGVDVSDPVPSPPTDGDVPQIGG